jgi:hypothetical protein
VSFRVFLQDVEPNGARGSPSPLSTPVDDAVQLNKERKRDLGSQISIAPSHQPLTRLESHFASGFPFFPCAH